VKKEELKKIISLHGLWLAGEVGGIRADLQGANLRDADLQYANLQYADLLGANLRGADLLGANLRDADLQGADLQYANLRGANLQGANLRGADLLGANLRGANLQYANLQYANLQGADLQGANLRDADLQYANLQGANLSQVKNILIAREWLGLFETDETGIIVYRAQHGGNTHPAGWEFKPGAFLTEIPNPDRCTPCASGVAFATLDWVRKNYENAAIWKCRIRWIDLADVVVPYGTDGKARCARLELLEVVS